MEVFSVSNRCAGGLSDILWTKNATNRDDQVAVVLNLDIQYISAECVWSEGDAVYNSFPSGF